MPSPYIDRRISKQVATYPILRPALLPSQLDDEFESDEAWSIMRKRLNTVCLWAVSLRRTHWIAAYVYGGPPNRAVAIAGTRRHLQVVIVVPIATAGKRTPKVLSKRHILHCARRADSRPDWGVGTEKSGIRKHAVYPKIFLSPGTMLTKI